MEQAALIQEVWIDSGWLPGITWADDIHPIFIRNKCGNCHTRGQEDVVEGLNQFSLGIIDLEDTVNPYFSYRELVYIQGAPLIMDGETLRDGQCCWPKGFPADRQRRIWLGTLNVVHCYVSWKEIIITGTSRLVSIEHREAHIRRGIVISSAFFRSKDRHGIEDIEFVEKPSHQTGPSEAGAILSGETFQLVLVAFSRYILFHLLGASLIMGH